MWPLDGHPQHYPWGSHDAVPAFLGRDGGDRPWAEVWYGAHPLGPSWVPGRGMTLDALIGADPHEMLGEDIARAFAGTLPYLLKLIAPARPLSLQVHPTREHAAESFAAENAAGLPLEAPERNYRDDNHKPEMVVALERFEALCGFRTPRRAAAILSTLGTPVTDRLHALLRERPDAHGMRAAFRTLVAPALRPEPAMIEQVAAACGRRFEAGSSPSPRIDRTVADLHEHFPGDPGVAAALLLNPVSLRPGEAMFVPAGAIHCYLSGLAIEIMAASDNVLRAGLTGKKVDVEEMLQCVSMHAAPPLRVAPETLTPTTVAYFAPIDDFELSVTTVADEPAATGQRHPVPGSGPRILLALDGDVLVDTATDQRRLRRGEAVFVPAAAGALSVGGAGRIAQASIP